MKKKKLDDYKDYVENYDEVVRITDFENFFSVYDDMKRGCLMFNINATTYFNLANVQLPSIQLQHDAFWPQISYIVYSTPRLAWLLMKLNNVKPKNMFDIVKTGTIIKYLSTETMQTIIQNIN